MENNTEVVKFKKLVTVPPNGFIRVDWQDYPENRTLETINRVKTYFAEKYELPKSSIKINFIPIVKNSAGKIVDITEGECLQLCPTERICLNMKATVF